MSRLVGRVAVVTGAASGIGLAASGRFAAEGAFVVMADRDRVGLDAAIANEGERTRLISITADVTSMADLAVLRDHVAAKHKKVDVLFGNAGIATFAPLGDVSEEAFDRTVAINFKGTFFTVQTLLPVMHDGASIILTSSLVATKTVPSFSVYSATKAALTSLARSFALDLKDRGIRVNTVAPGHIETAIGRNAGLSQREIHDYLRQTAGGTPLGRNGPAEDIAAAALFLASEESAFVTGVEISVDGGFRL